MAKFDGIEPAIGFYAATLALFQGLLDQKAADRGRLIVFVEGLMADLTPEERKSSYGLALEQALRSFEQLQQFPNIPEGP